MKVFVILAFSLLFSTSNAYFVGLDDSMLPSVLSLDSNGTVMIVWGQINGSQTPFAVYDGRSWQQYDFPNSMIQNEDAKKFSSPSFFLFQNKVTWPVLSFEVSPCTFHQGSRFYIGFQEPSGTYFVIMWDGSKNDVTIQPFQPLPAEMIRAVALNGSTMYLGGSFTSVNGTLTNNILSFDGTNFYNLQNGTNSPISSLAVFNNDLYAALFPTVGCMKWDGFNWTSIVLGNINVSLGLNQLIAVPGALFWAETFSDGKFFVCNFVIFYCLCENVFFSLLFFVFEFN